MKINELTKSVNRSPLTVSQLKRVFGMGEINKVDLTLSQMSKSYYILADGTIIGSSTYGAIGSSTYGAIGHYYIVDHAFGIKKHTLKALNTFCEKYKAIRIASEDSIDIYTPPTDQQYRAIYYMMKKEGIISADLTFGSKTSYVEAHTMGELRRAIDAHYQLTETFQERSSRVLPCLNCNGKGKTEFIKTVGGISKSVWKKCKYCWGKGEITIPYDYKRAAANDLDENQTI